jgi:hypothetical protein
VAVLFLSTDEGARCRYIWSIDPGMTAVGREAIAKHARLANNAKTSPGKENAKRLKFKIYLKILTHAEIIERLTR